MMRGGRVSCGFTLIELLIYVGVFAAVTSIAVGMVFNATRIQNRESGAGEVSDQSQFVLERVKRAVRDSSLIEVDANTQTSTLVLRMREAVTDPTVIFASGTAVYLREGVSSPVLLTSNRVSVESLTFTKFSSAPGKDTVQIDLTLSSASSSNPQLAFGRAVRTAISRVSAAIFDSSILPGADNTYDIGLASPQRWRNARFSGTVTIDTKLAVGTSTALNAFDVYGAAAVGTYGGAITAPPSGLIVSGNVGIGTTTPQHALSIFGAEYSVLYGLTDGATISVNWNSGNTQKVTLGGNRAVSFSNGQAGGKYVLILAQDGTGNRTVSWPGSVRFSSNATPTLTTTGGKTDLIGFIYDGTYYFGVASMFNF